MRALAAAILAVLFLAFPALAAEVTAISAPEARAALDKGEIVLVDVRQPEEWKQTGVAKGATLIPLHHPQGGQGFIRDLLAATGGNRDARIALICRTGNRSGKTAHALADMGFTHILDVSEGMAGSAAGPGWLKRDLPLQPCDRC
jgi:rhodanese-related sulfurtransferase